ncbi:hypothetical protein KBB60_01400 [Patescibacteria group bacterium]|nr:hypothetical protein [Patescibacteria group bacterium]
MSVQATLVIVKPDGIEKGLTTTILNKITEMGLVVTDRVAIRLSRQWVEELYDKERHKWHFEYAVEWVSSAPVRLLRVEGEDAVSLVKWSAIGRYPQGIRGCFAENCIKNVAHASDSAESAERELTLSESLFRKELERMQAMFTGKTVFALTGMSECGKSTAGMYFDSRGIPRLKIKNLFDRIRAREASDLDLATFVAQQESSDKLALWDRFINELLREIDAREASAVSIESLYGDDFARHLKYVIGDALCLVYIDIPLELRVIRQMGRENLDSSQEARKMLLHRDEIKAASGIERIKDFADEIIDNSGTMQSLEASLDRLILNRKLGYLK